MIRMLLAGAALLLDSTPAAEPSVGDFLNHWAALGRYTPAIAPLSTDYSWISDQMSGLAHGYAAEIDAAQKGRRPPRACLPPMGQRSFNPDDVLRALLEIAPDRRAMPLKTAFYAFMDKRYACPASVSPASPSAPAAPGTAPG